MNPCVKTGCNIALVDSPDNIYRGDAYYFEGKLLFKVRKPEYRPADKVDFMLEGDYLEVTDVLLTSIGSVALMSSEVFEMWKKYCPQLLGMINIDV